jgi:DNA-binding SARP family transcriptional activator
MPDENPAGATPVSSAPAATVTAVRKLLADLEDLKVTLADGPPALVERLLTTAAAEVRLGPADREAAWAGQGRRAVILVGFDGHHDAPSPTPATASAQPDAEIIRRETVGAALDLIAAKAVTTRRSLTETAAGAGQPGDADLGLTLLVSRIAPARSELSLLIDLVDEPGRVAALLPAHGAASAGSAPGKVNVVMVKPAGSDLETIIAVAPPPVPPPAELAAVAPAASVSILLGTATANPATVTTAPSRPARKPVAPEPQRPEPQRPEPQRQQPQRPSPPARLRIGLLGQLTINGQPGALLPAQTQLIVALAVNGPAGLSNGQLCDLLGADADHPKPADSLRQLIARTRRQLGQADDGKEWIIHLGHGQYALHPNSRVDWREFQTLTDEGIAAKDGGKLAAALSMIRGQPFTGCYYWWLDFELVDSVNAKIVAAATALGELALALPDPASAARAARIGLVADATAEELWRLLMRAEHAAGNLAGVRDAWSRCRDAVAEVAADGQPQRATTALHRSLTGRNPER